MVLLLIIILAILSVAIQTETDDSSRTVTKARGCCPGCQSTVDLEWMVCPLCQHRLKDCCPSCHRGKSLSHRFCPYCGSSAREGLS